MSETRRWNRRSVRAVKRHQRDVERGRRRELRREAAREAGQKKPGGCVVAALAVGVVVAVEVAARRG